ncbi:hydroxyacylglutathione hydrolase [Salinihabitans flavidus]|uniref:Hydroxyacylglutathione hydrolase n=1 Tax=Salinihabitans flavidus TaxID=569882 RepID=A0A1H8SI44_9RHOB|nr:hydroxyacylglutathione hydrolase [Salinihabitans flavidus]SEO78196.1 hydroxyacylglutathione hydrolase [Salinihabitans flavidus]
MPLEIVTLPCRTDNYAFLIHDAASGETAVVDVPEAAPISAALKERGWTLSHVLLTHHHGDHVEGLSELLAEHPAKVVGARADRARLPPLDVELSEGDTITIGGETAQVLDVSGHTVGHIAFYFPQTGAAFTADSLMALGCGRVFEGTPEMMWDSLSKLAALPPETVICSGHEYTLNNGRFALTVDPENPALKERVEKVQAARDANRPTVPSTLSEELATNPFLRGHDSAIQRTIGMEGADPAQVFAEVRRRKDNF